MAQDPTAKKARLGSKPPSGRGKNSNSATGTQGGTPVAVDIMSEREANVQEQSTGRKRVRQEMGATVNNDR